MEPSGVDLSISPDSSRVRGFTFSLGAVLTAAVVACSPAASASPVPVATTAASPGGAASTAPTAEARAIFHIAGGAPVFARSIVPDREAILPAAVVVDGDTYHAWIVAFASTPGTQDIHHLTSSDAVTWTVQLDDSLAGLSEGFADPGALPASVVNTGDDWAMYYTGVREPETEGWDIWRATAPGPDGPWTAGEEPVLDRGPAGAWDAGGLDFPAVVATEDGFAMYYSGIPSLQRETGSIGLATSADGLAWTKHNDAETTDEALVESDPVVTPGLCGAFDERAIHQPRVLPSANGWVMAYAGYAGDINSRPQVGFGDSGDGITWACEWPSPALDTSDLTGEGVHTINAFQHGDNPALLVEWLADDGTDVWLAEFGLGGS